MAVAETANLLVKMSLGGNFTSQLSKATKGVQNFDKSASRAFKAGSQIGTGIQRGAVLAAAGVGILVTQIGFGLDQLIQLESLTAQTNAVLKSTGNTAGQTADSIRTLAEKYESLNATIDDKVIQSGENLLLTFTAIRKDAFEPSLQAALDLSTALGTDLNSAVKTVGKALSDPAKAAGKLAKQGIILTKEEQKQIAAHLKNNDALGAQNVILQALEKRYGGSFLAGGNTTAGKVKKFGDAIEDLQKNLATALLPAIGNIADALNALFRDPETIAAVKKLGDQVGKLFSKENIKTGIGLLKDGFNTLKSIAGPIADVVGAAVKAFASLPPEIKTLLVGGFVANKLTGGLVTNIFGGIAEAIAKSFIRAPLVNVTGGVVTVNGPGGGLGNLLPEVAGGIGGLTAASVATVVAAAAVSTWAFLQTYNGPKAPSAFTPTIGSAFTPAKVDSSQLTGLGQAIAEQFGATPMNTPTATTHTAQQPTKGETDIKSTLTKLQEKTVTIAAAVKASEAKLAGKIEDDIVATKGGTSTLSGKLADDTQAVNASKTTLAAKIANDTSVGKVAADGISAAVKAARPIISIKNFVSGNSVSTAQQVTVRYGQPAASRNANVSAGPGK